MDHVHAIRHAVRVLGKSVRQVAKEFGVSRNTVRRYLDDSIQPSVRKPVASSTPVKDSVRGTIHDLLEQQAKTPHGKQRLTAARIHTLLGERGVHVGYTTVKEIVAEHKRKAREVFVPLLYRPGDLAEVDFFEVLVTLGDTTLKAFLFVMRLMCSGFDFACVLPRADQVCFLEGHVRAFAHFGAVPHRIAYDNLKAAVRRHLVGSERELSLRFGALASHYLFEPCFARPYTGHDKGGVEARGKGIRWQHLTPVPTAASLAEVNTLLLQRLSDQAGTQRDAQGRTVRERFEAERAQLLSLPAASFRSEAVMVLGANRQSLVRLDGAQYSVPCTWAGLMLTVHAGAEHVRIERPSCAGASETDVEHARMRSGERCIDYRHYLPELAKKPQALRQVADALIPTLASPFDRAWKHLVDEHGPKQAARIFAQVLRALVERGREEVAARIEEALTTGEPLQLALRGRAVERVLAAEQVPASLQQVEVESADVAAFDALLEEAS